MWITWKHEHTKLVAESQIAEKIEVFQHRVWGWQLHIADLVINGGKSHDGTKNFEEIPHAGFATLHILLSYFEMIARYETGNIGKDQSREVFIEGVQSVFPQVKEFPYAPTRKFLNLLYGDVRCGLYHMSVPGSGVAIGKTGVAIQYANNPPQILIDPHELARALKNHFEHYTNTLKDPNQTDLRKAFERRFDCDNKQ